jgi:glycosyltransferase involved in cell wall biosynthesis
MSPYYEKGISPKGIHRLALSIHVSCTLSHRVIALTRAVRDELIQYGISSNKVRVIPAPIDVRLYTHTSPDGIRESLGLNPQHTIITSIGHAIPLKGWDILIHSFNRVVRSNPQARLLLVGSLHSGEEADFTASLKAFVNRLAIGDKVFFLGQRKDIPQILRASDVFVFPSRSDGQGMALTEALASGLPCVASRSGGITDLITHRCNGLLFNREDVDGLTNHLNEVIHDQTLMQVLKANALKSAQRYDMNFITNRMMHLYEGILIRKCKI